MPGAATGSDDDAERLALVGGTVEVAAGLPLLLPAPFVVATPFEADRARPTVAAGLVPTGGARAAIDEAKSDGGMDGVDGRAKLELEGSRRAATGRVGGSLPKPWALFSRPGKEGCSASSGPFPALSSAPCPHFRTSFSSKDGV